MDNSLPFKKMNVLVACEESQVVMNAFLQRGHNAFSADLQKCSGGRPDRHYNGDVKKILDPKNLVQYGSVFDLPIEIGFEFYTQDGSYHWVENWDLVIAHPPCTFLAASGACNLFNKDHTIKNFERYKDMLDARDFFMFFYNLNVDKVVIENPRPLSLADLPRPSCKIHPWQFGDAYTKYTYLWCKGVSPLMPLFTDFESVPKSWCRVYSTAKQRSKTFTGIAQAMADQWG